MKLVTVAEMQAIEREANAAGLTYTQMMENAGVGVAKEIIQSYGYSPDKSVLGLVGSGNNGGDTLVALAYLAGRGWRASAYEVRPRSVADPLVARLLDAGGRYLRSDEDADHRKIIALLDEHNVVLDGVLGTGVHLPLKPEVADILRVVQHTLQQLSEPPHVVAVDCPSGVDCDSGEAADECLTAEMTVTMAAAKQGLLRFPAFKLVGDLRVTSIGNLEELGSWKSIRRFVADAETVRTFLPPRPMDAHKGTFGVVLVVAGCLNYTGAALLSGEAAYRMGAGWVTLAIPEPLHPILASQFPEATWLLLPHQHGFISADAAPVVNKGLSRVTAMLMGPGFGLEHTTRDFIAHMLGFSLSDWRSGIGAVVQPAGEAHSRRVNLPPLVVDADGLKLLAQLPDWPMRLPAPAVLTPHPGEMSSLATLSRDEIQADRMAVAERYAREWGHVIVLKGPCTVIAAPDGQTAVVPVATPALARAGTGDVLAGMIVGLRAQGVDAFQAATAGAWIHAQAGLRAAETLGNTASVIAGDVLAAVAEILSELML